MGSAAGAVRGPCCMETSRPPSLGDPGSPDLWFPSGPGNPGGDGFVLKVQNVVSKA